MSKHPQTTHFRNLAQESEDGWAISELCDLLDSQYAQTESALVELADAGKPRVVTTARELDALPLESVVTDAYETPYVCEKHRVDGTGNEWRAAGTTYLQESQYVLDHGDVTVHYAPDPTR